jgi:P27 family predicted phage terminase small subunit
LSPEGKREWTRIVTSLPEGLLTKVDRAFLAAWCQNWSDFVAAVRDLEENGWDYVTEKGYQGSRPAVARMHKAQEKLITLGGKLGLSPADRTRLTMPEKPKEDPFDAFLRGKTTNG